MANEKYIPLYESDKIHYTTYQTIQKMFIDKIESQELERYGKLTVADYFQTLDEYYRFQFERYMSENTLRVFGIIKHISRFERKDPISWKEIFYLYVSADQFRSLSRVQFVKGLDALKTMNLIHYEIIDINQATERYNIKLVDVSNIILKLLRTAVKFGYNSKEYLYGIGLLKTKIKSKQENKRVNPEEEFATKFNNLKKKYQIAFTEFFDFLGSFNTSSKIQMSRKLQILNQTLEYVEKGVVWSDVLYAIKQTMEKTSSGGNKFKERYYYAILRNIDIENSEEREEGNVAVDKESPSKPIKIVNGKFTYTLYDNNNDISDEQYEELMQSIQTVTMVYEDIMKALVNWQNKGDNYNKLINHCKLLDTRVHEFYNNETNDEARQKFLKQKYDVTEKIYFDSNYIRHIFWFKYNKQLKYDCVLKVLKKYKDTFLSSDILTTHWSKVDKSMFIMAG